MTDMAIIVPSRGRPHTVAEMATAWRDTDASARLVYAVDDDDPALADYVEAARDAAITLRVGPRRRLAGTLNDTVASAITLFPIVGFFGDDHRPRTPGWDARFEETLSAGMGIVYGNDLLMRDRLPTAVVMTSDIPRTLGYMCPPPLVHLCLDVVWLDWGRAIQRITYLDDVVIEHMHPAAGKAKLDDRYREVNSKQQVDDDNAAYAEYRHGGRFDDDVAKLIAVRDAS